MENTSRKAVIYEDLRKISCSALSLWKLAYTSAVNDSKPSTWHEMLSDDSLQKALIALDITKTAQEFPLQLWGEYFDAQMLSIHSLAANALERHGAYLNSDALNALLCVVHYKHHEISTIRAYDQQAKIPRPTNLGGFIILNRKWLDAILKIYEWTVSVHSYLIENGFDNVLSPCVFTTLVDKRALKAAFDNGVYEQQMREYENWQEQNLFSADSIKTLH